MKGSEKLIETIKLEGVQPVPAWQFSMKNSLAWAGFLLASLVGGLAFSVILFAIQQTDFSVVSHLSHSRLELLLGLLPFIWIAFLILALGIAFYCIQHSKKGYKFTAAKLAGFSAILSILLGTLFFIGGGAHQLEHAFAVNVELYQSIEQKKVKLWSMPEDGYLSGKIVETGTDYFILKDFHEKSWKISYASAFVAPVVRLEEGETVKLVGKITAKGLFAADEVRPWGGRGARMRRGG